jgi:hypothetical protein
MRTVVVLAAAMFASAGAATVAQDLDEARRVATNICTSSGYAEGSEIFSACLSQTQSQIYATMYAAEQQRQAAAQAAAQQAEEARRAAILNWYLGQQARQQAVPPPQQYMLPTTRPKQTVCLPNGGGGFTCTVQ